MSARAVRPTRPWLRSAVGATILAAAAGCATAQPQVSALVTAPVSPSSVPAPTGDPLPVPSIEALPVAAALRVVAAPVGMSVQAATTAPAAAPPTMSPKLVAASAMRRSVPLRVRIPAIGVDSNLMSLGLSKDGSLEVPPRGFPAGWYAGGPTPGERGPAVIAGHVDWAGSAGVFSRLHSLRPSDEVFVQRADGSTAVFRVTKVARYSKDAFPTQLVYGNLGYAGLRLITCGGAFDSATHHYVDNWVVFATLVS